MEKWFAVGEGKIILLPVVRAFLWGTLAGFTITATLLLPGWRATTEVGGVDGVRLLMAQRDELTTLLDKQNKNLADCSKLVKELTEATDGSTILYETDPASPQQSALVVIGQLAGMPAPVPAAQPLPRWVLPGRVTPFLIGPSRGEVYYHIAPGKSMEERQGPFLPKVPPAGSHGEFKP